VGETAAHDAALAALVVRVGGAQPDAERPSRFVDGESVIEHEQEHLALAAWELREGVAQRCLSLACLGGSRRTTTPRPAMAGFVLRGRASHASAQVR
jgi:hypothetical protein